MSHYLLPLMIIAILSLLSPVLLASNDGRDFVASAQLGGFFGGDDGVGLIPRAQEGFVPNFEEGVRCLAEDVKGILMTGRIGNFGLDRTSVSPSSGSDSSECGCGNKDPTADHHHYGGVFERPVRLPVASELGAKHWYVKSSDTGQSAGFTPEGVGPEVHKNGEFVNLILPLDPDQLKCVMDEMKKQCSAYRSYGFVTNNCQHCVIVGLEACGISHDLSPQSPFYIDPKKEIDKVRELKNPFRHGP